MSAVPKVVGDGRVDHVERTQRGPGREAAVRASLSETDLEYAEAAAASAPATNESLPAASAPASLECTSCVYPLFKHPQELLQQLTEVDDSMVAIAFSLLEKLRNNVDKCMLSQDIVRYAQPPEGITSRDLNELLTVRACFDWRADLDRDRDLAASEGTSGSLANMGVQCTVKELTHACFDLLVVRAQFLCPAGDNVLFVEVVRAAYGEPIRKASPLHSQILNAYKKTLSSLPNSFVSKSSKRAPRKKRGSRRPRSGQNCPQSE